MKNALKNRAILPDWRSNSIKDLLDLRHFQLLGELDQNKAVMLKYISKVENFLIKKNLASNPS